MEQPVSPVTNYHRTRREGVVAFTAKITIFSNLSVSRVRNSGNEQQILSLSLSLFFLSGTDDDLAQLQIFCQL